MTDTKTTPTDLDVKPRDISFALEDARKGHWLGGDPVGTAVFNALSLTFPDGERLFMDAVKNYRHLLTGKLLEDAKGFIAQEAIHSREHASRNETLAGVQPYGSEMEAIVKALTQSSRRGAPQATQLESPIGSSRSNTIFECSPRNA